MMGDKPKKLRSSGKGRGWNLRKGAQDYGKTNYSEAGRRGGSRRVPKGFSMGQPEKKR